MKYYITHSAIENQKVKSACETTGFLFMESVFTNATDLSNELINVIKIRKLKEVLSQCDFLICDSDKIDEFDALELGIFISLHSVESCLIMGQNRALVKKLNETSSYKTLKYRCFNLNKFEISDYIFAGFLYSKDTKIITYGNLENGLLMKAISYANFVPETLMSQFEGQLKDYELDPDDYDSFRKINDKVMLEVASSKTSMVEC